LRKSHAERVRLGSRSKAVLTNEWDVAGYGAKLLWRTCVCVISNTPLKVYSQWIFKVNQRQHPDDSE